MRTTVLTLCSLGAAEGRVQPGQRGEHGPFLAGGRASGRRAGQLREAAFAAAMPSAGSRGRWRPGNEAEPGQHPPRPALPLASSTSKHRKVGFVQVQSAQENSPSPGVSRVHASARTRASHCGSLSPWWRRWAGGSARGRIRRRVALPHASGDGHGTVCPLRSLVATCFS